MAEPSKKETLEKRIKKIPYWYHKIELPDGIITPGWAPIDVDKYGIPDDLTDKRILDIGAWDGYWTFEALKRGAKEVVAIDDFSDDLGSLTKAQRNKWETFDLCREALGFTIKDSSFDCDLHRFNDKGQKVTRVEMSIYNINKEKLGLGHFDIVFFFGTIYHLKYPLKALEIISSICDGEIYIESAICDDFSPYRGGIDKGYPNNDMIMEFYPENQYGNNVNNWWVPTLQCLGNMVASVGFKGIKAWGLTIKPKDVPECRGFVYGSKVGIANENCIQLVNGENARFEKSLNIAAVMSVPRLGFMDNLFCVFEGLMPYKIPIIKVQGAFWGQCLERGIQTQIDTGADVILTIDYDTVFKSEDVGNLIHLMQEHPEADAIIPMQVGRNGMRGLLCIKSKSGQLRTQVPLSEFQPDIKNLYSGHFGLTLIRTSSLLKLPHPWFIAKPSLDGQWGEGRVDADINFWRKMEKAGMIVYSANRIVIGHLEMLVTWPNENLEPIYQTMKNYHETRMKPANVWK